MKFLNFFLLLCVIFALLDPDPDSKSGYGSTDLMPVPFWPLDPGSEMGKKSGSGSYFLELRNQFFGLKYVISGMEKIRIRDAGWKQVGSEIKTGSKTGAPDGRPGEEDAGAPGPGHGHAAGGAREVELLARHEHLLHLLSCRCSRCLANDRKALTKAWGSWSGRIPIVLSDPDRSRTCRSGSESVSMNPISLRRWREG